MDWGKELDECKKVLKIASDYGLAKEWKINKGRISQIRSKEIEPDAYMITRISLTLGRDPFAALVEQESRTEKNEGRRGWWRDFLCSLRGPLASLLGGLLIFGGSYNPGSAVPVRAETLNDRLGRIRPNPV